MTVGVLIDKLRKFDADKQVYLYGTSGDDGYYPVCGVFNIIGNGITAHMDGQVLILAED